MSLVILCLLALILSFTGRRIFRRSQLTGCRPVLHHKRASV
jgi:hypothetical protein